MIRVSLDGEIVKDLGALPPLLRERFAILTAYNPRSMLLPRRINDTRHQVLRDLLILGCYRVEHTVGYDEEPEGVFREPAWVVHGIGREESIHFGRTFRQNTIVYCQDARPELIVDAIASVQDEAEQRATFGLGRRGIPAFSFGHEGSILPRRTGMPLAGVGQWTPEDGSGK